MTGLLVPAAALEAAVERRPRLRDIAPTLRRPFTANAVKWKMQAVWPKADPDTGLAVCYIDRGHVIDRLNVTVPEDWHAEYTDINERGHMVCELTVCGVSHEDVGQGADPKSRRTDALKRAAVHFGIGVSLTRVPSSYLKVADGFVKQRQTRDGLSLELNQPGLDYLRDRYEKWLEAAGAAVFGEPYEHGDTEGGGQGDPDVPDEAPQLAEPNVREDLFIALTDSGFTLKKQVGFLTAAGVAQPPRGGGTIEWIASAFDTLTAEQADRLAELINREAAA